MRFLNKYLEVDCTTLADRFCSNERTPCDSKSTDVALDAAKKQRNTMLSVWDHVQQMGDVIAATRGNHGQSVAFSAARHGLAAVIVVPHGNSREKNRAMQGYGAELIEHGRDFQEALEHTMTLAGGEGVTLVPSFDMGLAKGVASYALELFRAAPDLHSVYVPIGLGSGICGLISARVRNALNS